MVTITASGDVRVNVAASLTSIEVEAHSLTAALLRILLLLFAVR
jgi:hypothetical protein